MPAPPSMLGYLSEPEGALEGLDDFGLAKEIQSEAEMKVEEPEDTAAQEESISDMAMTMNFARLGAVATAASMAGLLGALALGGMMRNMPSVTENDVSAAQQVAQNEGVHFNRSAFTQNNGNSTSQVGSSDMPSTTPSPEGMDSGEAEEVEEGEGAEDALPGQLPPPGSKGRGTGTVSPQSPATIAAELDRQKHAAKNDGEAELAPQLLADAIPEEDDATAQKLQKAADALPDKLPEIPKLPLDLPGDQQADGPQEGDPRESEANEPGENQEQTPQQKAAELDRQKQESRLQQEKNASGESDKVDDDDEREVDGDATGTSFDARPGSLLYLDWEFAACIPALFVLDFEPLVYIHEHFFGYYLMPDIPFLAVYMGFSKSHYEEPNFLHIVLFGMLILFELTLAIVSLLLILLPLLLVFFPVIMSTAIGLSIIGADLGEGGTFVEAFGSIVTSLGTSF